MNTRLSSNSQISFWQKPMFKAALAVITLAIVLTIVNFNIHKYEQHLATTDSVLLTLAPVDPRSLMQGDYMRLQFAIEDDILQALEQQNKEPVQTKDGWVIVKKDANNVGHFVRLVDKPETDLATDEITLFYRVRGGRVKFATGSFFFQEGHADKYADAEYGVLKINDKGEPLLVGLAGSDLKTITAHSDDMGDLENK